MSHLGFEAGLDSVIASPALDSLSLSRISDQCGLLGISGACCVSKTPHWSEFWSQGESVAGLAERDHQ
jgi:hypothetical protein